MSHAPVPPQPFSPSPAAAPLPAPAAPPGARRWTFAMPTPLGRTRSTYALGDDTLGFESDDAFGASETLRWDSIHEGGTAAMAGLGGPGAPDFPDWVPDRLEWLLLSRTAGGGEPFMRALPQGADRDAIVAALKARLGSRWVGERLPLKEAQARLAIASKEWSTLKVIGLVVAVLALLVLLLVVLLLLLHPVVSVPAGLTLGAWLLQKGRLGLRQSAAAAGMRPGPVAGAAPGPVVFEGRAVAAEVSPAGITGRACAWWDVTLLAYSEDSDRHGGQWRPLVARSGGAIDVVELDDGTARVPVWLHDAELLLETRSWETGKDELPPHGAAFLDRLGFPWNGAQRLRVTETGLQAYAPFYVLGTLDERRNVALAPAPTGLQRVLQLTRSGEWRAPLVRALPPPLRVVVAVLIGFLDIFLRLGHARARVARASDARVPELAPTTKMVWRGRAGQPFVVSDRPGQDAIAAWRQRSLVLGGLGIAALLYALYSLVELLSGR
jgi:hypothetical protein